MLPCINLVLQVWFFAGFIFKIPTVIALLYEKLGLISTDRPAQNTRQNVVLSITHWQDAILISLRFGHGNGGFTKLPCWSRLPSFLEAHTHRERERERERLVCKEKLESQVHFGHSEFVPHLKPDLVGTVAEILPWIRFCTVLFVKSGLSALNIASQSRQNWFFPRFLTNEIYCLWTKKLILSREE